jgi:hypothetical protein
MPPEGEGGAAPPDSGTNLKYIRKRSKRSATKGSGTLGEGSLPPAPVAREGFVGGDELGEEAGIEAIEERLFCT